MSTWLDQIVMVNTTEGLILELVDGIFCICFAEREIVA